MEQTNLVPDNVYGRISGLKDLTARIGIFGAVVPLASLAVAVFKKEPRALAVTLGAFAVLAAAMTLTLMAARFFAGNVGRTHLTFLFLVNIIGLFGISALALAWLRLDPVWFVTGGLGSLAAFFAAVVKGGSVFRRSIPNKL